MVLLARLVGEVGGNRPVVLAAASWGAIIAAGLAARQPHLVGKMVLGSLGVRPSQAMIDVINEGRQMHRSGRDKEVGQLLVERFGERLPRSFQKRIVKQFQNLPREQAAAFDAHSEFVGNASHLHDVVDLDKIACPTLIVMGEDDAILDPHDAHEAAARIANCQVRIVADAGHFLHWERPEILNVYDRFLATA